MYVKSMWASRTFWANVLLGLTPQLVEALTQGLGALLAADATDLVTIGAFLNILLRRITTQPVRF